MPRYDLMHWSVRVRDQQAANARTVTPVPVAASPPVSQPRKPCVARPKPPRDEDAEQLLRVCREGRLFELQAWIAAGRPLTVPADMALRQACQDDDLKWVSLLMWLGANPRSKGLTTEDLDGPDEYQDPEYQRSALQIACSSKKPEILKRLKPDPELDDLRELMAAAASWSVTPETVAYLVRLGADINDKVDGGSTVLDRCLNSFGWKEAVWDDWYRKAIVPMARLGVSLDALRFLLDKGARWTPDERSIGETRRALYRVEGDAIVAVIDLLRSHQATDEATLNTLIRAPKMRSILSEVARLRTNTERRAQPAATERGPRAGRQSATPSSPVRRLPPSRYNRERLYEEVWAEPTQKVAERYGVSDVAIAKACALLDIPKPPRGYWARKAADQKLPARPSLPKYDR